MSTPRDINIVEDVERKIKREGEAGRRQGGAGVLNTVTPCAACKLLRRRCAQECPFSPYFSPHEPHKFASVHKVFGASNVSKMLMEVPQEQRADAANSLVYEANLRLRDPVYGCMGAISALQQQLQSLEMELQAVRAHILRHKLRQATINAGSHSALLSPCVEARIPSTASDASSSIYASPSSPVTSANCSSVTVTHNLPYF